MGTANSVKAQGKSAFEQLLLRAEAHKGNNVRYAGEVTAEDAYSYLAFHQGVIVDVRTLPEWQFVGIPDLSRGRGRLVTLSWKTYPQYGVNPDFVDSLSKEEGIDQDTPLFFLCRSGGRSLDAAAAMTEAGFRYCFNITSGFEGQPNAEGHRGTSNGWKASKLPWQQG